MSVGIPVQQQTVQPLGVSTTEHHASTSAKFAMSLAIWAAVLAAMAVTFDLRFGFTTGEAWILSTGLMLMVAMLVVLLVGVGYLLRLEHPEGGALE